MDPVDGCAGCPEPGPLDAPGINWLIGRGLLGCEEVGNQDKRDAVAAAVTAHAILGRWPLGGRPRYRLGETAPFYSGPA